MLVLEETQQNTQAFVNLCFLGFSPQKKARVWCAGAGVVLRAAGALGPSTAGPWAGAAVGFCSQALADKRLGNHWTPLVHVAGKTVEATEACWRDGVPLAVGKVVQCRSSGGGSPDSQREGG